MIHEWSNFGAILCWVIEILQTMIHNFIAEENTANELNILYNTVILMVYIWLSLRIIHKIIT